MHAVSAERIHIGSGIVVDDEGESVPTVYRARFVQLAREVPIDVLGAFHGVIGDLPGECGFESREYRYARFVPNGSRLGRVRWRESQSSAAAGRYADVEFATMSDYGIVNVDFVVVGGGVVMPLYGLHGGEYFRGCSVSVLIDSRC